MILQTDTSAAILDRHCAICAKKLKITVYPNKTYKGGHFFFKVEIGKGKKAEYWKCNRCHFDES